MKRYTGKLYKDTENKLKAFAPELKRALGQNLASLGKVGTPVTTIDETIEKYNAGISKEEIQAWVWYRVSKGIPMHGWENYKVKMTENTKLNLVTKRALFFDPIEKELVPYPVYVFGNIYSKINKLQKYEDEITSNFGSSVYADHLKTLEDNKPKPISVQNPIEGERPVILPISEFARTFSITSLRSDSGVILPKPTDLQDAFKEWLRNAPEDYFKKTQAFYIIRFFLNNENKPRNIDKLEFNEIKKHSADEGNALFKKFLHEALETSDQQRIDAHYNSNYNATASLQYNKIPIGIKVSRKFKGFDLQIKPAQREGIAFMELVGSGIIAYDVGVGKTITAIIEVASAINNGKCKRPLIVVPNPTYNNWVREIEGEDSLEGVLSGTGITLNKWYNLGVDYDHINLDKAVPERSITLVTYEGLNKIGFNEYTQQEHFEQLSNILGQRTEQTERQSAKENEKIREIIGVGLNETIADIETLGLDYIAIDEAHNFKNVFSDVKSDENNNKHFQIQGGSPSNRAIKAFFLCNYIQRKYGRNVMLLTATPFTNSPLEIYSMLSLVAYEYMVKNNILHIRHFFEQYIQETSEYVVGQNGEIKLSTVVKSFNNRISLQKLINSHINFKTGDEANIPRPCKINLPKTTVQTDKGLTKLDKDNQILTYLELSEQQKINQSIINAEASKGGSKDDPGRLLRLMSQSLNNALSPFLYDGTPKDYVDYVENSPKILYTLECIREVKQWHEKRNQPVSGQVIYMDRGKDYFHYIKEYLERELGYKKNKPLKSNPRLKVDEVEIISSGISGSKKEKIKDAFNEGVCKIIIGTSTIKEGINLQENATCLYNTYPNWNPTDIRQLEGRIWRQKNKFGYVRIVMPLMENSMDIFVFQKLEEKTSRINDLWNKSDRGNVLDEESLDPNEVKFALVTDLNVLVRFELKQLSSTLSNNITVLKKKTEDLTNYAQLKNKYSRLKENMISKISQAYESFKGLLLSSANGRYVYYRDVPTLDLENETQDLQKKVERYNKAYEQLSEIMQGNYEDKEMILAYGSYKRIKDSQSSWSSYDYDFDTFKDTVSQLAKMTKTLFTDRGYDENTNIEQINEELLKELEKAEAEYEDLKTEEFQRKLYNKIRAEKQRLAIKGGDLETRVQDFASLNHLLSYKFSDIDPRSCIIPTKENQNVRSSDHKSENQNQTADKDKRKRLAIAKAKALKLELMLLEY